MPEEGATSEMSYYRKRKYNSKGSALVAADPYTLSGQVIMLVEDRGHEVQEPRRRGAAVLQCVRPCREAFEGAWPVPNVAFETLYRKEVQEP